MWVGLPFAGHPLFGGQDVRLTALAEASEGLGDSGGDGVGDYGLAQCVVLLAGGRVVGAGAIRTTIDAAVRANVVDSLVRNEIMDRKTASDRAGSPAGAWFSLDLDRMVEGSQPASEMIKLPEYCPGRSGLGLALAGIRTWIGSNRNRGFCSFPRGESSAGSLRRPPRWRRPGVLALRRVCEVLTSSSMISRWMTTSASRCSISSPASPIESNGCRKANVSSGSGSILGSESVRAALRDARALNMMRKAVELRIITEPRQITYLDIDSLESLSRVLDRYSARTKTPRSCRFCGRHWPAHRHPSLSPGGSARRRGCGHRRKCRSIAGAGLLAGNARGGRLMGDPVGSVAHRVAGGRHPHPTTRGGQTIRGLGPRIFPN